MPCRRRSVFMPGPHRPVRHDLRLVPILRRILAVLAATAVGIGLAHAQGRWSEARQASFLPVRKPCAPGEAGRRQAARHGRERAGLDRLQDHRRVQLARRRVSTSAIGYITSTTKPTAFYSVNRPPLYNGLIPSTWKAPATSVYGRLTDGLYDTIQAKLEPYFGGDFATRTDANTAPAGGYPRIDGLNASALRSR
jgi:hypothetical protein